ncbi:MAG: amidohydrolase family protein [Ignavibacteriae bacterium]|nr:amidohydrolase family protein [Ignavibacteriota bacterium]
MINKLQCGLILLGLAILTHTSISQTTPPEGIRVNTPTVHALTNARIVPSPGKVIEKGTLVIRDGVIVGVGAGVAVPADARVWDMKGQTIYPGLIDSYSDYGLPKAPKPEPESEQQQRPRPTAEPQRGADYWNTMVVPQNSAAELFSVDAKEAEKLRAQGITSALIVPQRGIIKGKSAVVNLGDGKPNDLLVREGVAHHIQLADEYGHDGYPGSLMGVIAMIRQALYDAEWYGKAQEAYSSNKSLERPEMNEALAALREVLGGKIPVVIETRDELECLRAEAIAKEFGLKLMLRGSGREYRRLDAINTLHRSIILPVNFPETPVVDSPPEALQYSLEDLRHWDEAPENPARMQSAEMQFSLTSATLKDASTFLGAVRKCVARGLRADAALAALTTTPAKMFGVNDRLGSLEVGKAANFIVTSGELFNEKTLIRESWIDGKRYAIKPLPELDPRGIWNITIAGRDNRDSLILRLKAEPELLQGTFRKGKQVNLRTVSRTGLHLAFSFPGDSVGYEGVVRMSAALGENTMNGTGEWASGEVFAWSGVRIGAYVPDPDTTKPKPPEMSSFAPVYPLGEFGRTRIPEQPATIFVRNATLWTSGPQGTMENCDLLIEKGKIVRVGKNLAAPSDAVVIDGTNKHVTPGIIDAHSHMAASGSVNEAGQTISAETRIGDIIDCNEINIYRALAGGLTTSHILHGSANPIGGQAQLIKLRWGMLPDEMKFEGAPPTIKFALGENVKQSNWGERFATRYPQTRMGVEQIMRDEFQAALDYEKAWQKWEKEKTGIPPRRDLELETILEILRAKRFVHCHSYVQSEILMLMRVAEDFGFRIRVFQHILEGYKVADVMAKHGAGASSFSDWWAYKLEVYDAIPYNGALMHEQGVLVSFNSDSDELTRRMNWEAAKAVKYGGVTEVEALKFVTINPAKQLMVDNRVGSLEPGKDADFVVWSGSPLSTYSLCEQTWIEGRKFFDRDEDSKMNGEIQKQRAVLIQKVLAAKKADGEAQKKKPEKKGDEFDHHGNETIGGIEQ